MTYTIIAGRSKPVNYNHFSEYKAATVSHLDLVRTFSVSCIIAERASEGGSCEIALMAA